MNDADGPAWSGAEQFDAIGAAAEHDFGSLIDFDDIDLGDFNKFNQIDFGDGQDAQLGELAESLDVQHLHNPFSPAGVSQEHRGGAGGPQQRGMDTHGIPTTGDNFFQFSMPPYSQANAPVFGQAQEQMYRPHHAVPPTPNSTEMHGDPGRYLHQMDPQQAMFDQRYQMRKDEVCRALEKARVQCD